MRIDVEANRTLSFNLYKVRLDGKYLVECFRGEDAVRYEELFKPGVIEPPFYLEIGVDEDDGLEYLNIVKDHRTKFTRGGQGGIDVLLQVPDVEFVPSLEVSVDEQGHITTIPPARIRENILVTDNVRTTSIPYEELFHERVGPLHAASFQLGLILPSSGLRASCSPKLGILFSPMSRPFNT